MQPFVRHTGIAVPLLRINVDTDAIIPSREMKTVGKRGLSGGLFAGWRYTTPGSREPDPAFVLNQPAYAGASILLSGANFGCGSSREHAVWALAEYGIRCVIAASFGAIFHNNCIRNGLLPVVLDEASIQALAAQLLPGDSISIDLERCTIAKPAGATITFSIEDAHRAMLLEGLDAIGLTLKHRERIEAHIALDRTLRTWVYPPLPR